MKTVAKIDPEKEYENAKKLIELASKKLLESDEFGSLDSSVDNLITAARVLMDREERRRGKKSIPKESKPKGRNKGESRQEARKLPSVRFPDLEIEEHIIFPEEVPTCPCCGGQMRDSGLFDTSEKLEMVPKRYYIARYIRPKFNCGCCHGAMVNTPAPLSIIPGSNYGDSLVIDATLSKFCDLIPLERYVQIAFRDGLEQIPAQSLIGLTHHLANFLNVVYLKIKDEVQRSLIMLADETPHKMLEGDHTKNWFLWGFFCKTASYFETHNTRSGDVVFEVLKESDAKYLVTDGYTGYNRATRKIKDEYNREIILADCNAHALRYFKESGDAWTEDCAPFLEIYEDIYKLEETRKENAEHLSDKEQLDLRSQMIPYFKELKDKCSESIDDAMPESGLKKALGYFLNHYDGLTLCTKILEIPLDNNTSEREMRPQVVGRKTWYGTHSKRGALTAAIHFSIIQSCKVNNVNPRKYYHWIVRQILKEQEILTPYQYSLLKETQ